MSGKFIKFVTNPGTIRYPHLFEMWAGIEGSKPSFSCLPVIAKTDTEKVKEFQDKIQEAMDEGKKKFGNKWKNPRNPMKDGDEQQPGNDLGFKGHYFFNCKSYNPVDVYDIDSSDITKENSNKIYGGIEAKVSVNLYTYCKGGNCGVGVGLRGLKKTAEGDPLSSRGNTKKDFLDDDDMDLLG